MHAVGRKNSLNGLDLPGIVGHINDERLADIVGRLRLKAKRQSLNILRLFAGLPRKMGHLLAKKHRVLSRTAANFKHGFGTGQHLAQYCEDRPLVVFAGLRIRKVAHLHYLPDLDRISAVIYMGSQ